MNNNGRKQKGHDPERLNINTSVNIKKAAAKKAIKKGGKVTGLCMKKILQWALNIVLTLLLMGTICGVIVGGAFAIYVKNYLIDEDYDITGLKTNLDMTTEIYAADSSGKYVELEDERIYGTENRSWVSYQKMPKILTHAFIAIEDERYWQHNGVDWKRTLGAVLQFAQGNDSYGGSTITQQLIKNITEEDDTTIQRKVTEIFRALTLTEKRSKEEILEMYLNTISLGRRTAGVQAAANYYFGKDVENLSLVECAALASIPKSPTKYDPVRNPDNNRERRELVLGKMLELEWISEEDYNEAMNTELVLNITLDDDKSEAVKPYSYFKDALIEQLILDFNEQYGYSREYASNLIYSGGLKIYVTMDTEVQAAMEEVFENPDSFPKYAGIQPESAMVVMDPFTGDILGLVGGRGEKTGRRELNRATMSKRQVGSSIKPLTVYSPAMDLGLITYSSVLDDAPTYWEKMKRYWPSNSPNRYVGKITVNEAVMLSKNTTAVQLIQTLTPEYSFNFAKKKLHLDSLEKSDCDVAPLALGGLTKGLTVYEMTAAYSIFPGGGSYAHPRMYTKVCANDGTVLLENKPEQTPVISQGTATVMTKILQNVVTGGTAAGITLDNRINIAGKTGSTNDNKDIYFCGFTPYYVGACWFGYDIPKDLGAVGNPAMLAWEKVMEKIHKKHFDAAKNGTPLKTFDFSSLETASFCLDSGMAPGEHCSKDVRTVLKGTSRIGTGYYYKGSGKPASTCSVHIPVKWDKSENCLANDYCPEEDVIDVSLIYENNRLFEKGNVAILDAAYTYRPLPANAIYPVGAPFYQYTLPKDAYAGYTPLEEGEPVNKMCDVHKKPDEPEITDGENPDGEDISGNENEENGVVFEDPFDITETPGDDTEADSEIIPGDNGEENTAEDTAEDTENDTSAEENTSDEE